MQPYINPLITELRVRVRVRVGTLCIGFIELETNHGLQLLVAKSFAFHSLEYLQAW